MSFSQAKQSSEVQDYMLIAEVIQQSVKTYARSILEACKVVRSQNANVRR